MTMKISVFVLSMIALISCSKNHTRFLNEHMGSLSLGVGFGDKGEAKVRCGSGIESVVNYTKPEVIYRFRTYRPKTLAAEFSILVAEMVIIDQHKDYNSIANTDNRFFDSKEEFESTCGTQYVNRVYSSARIAFLTTVETKEANSIETFEWRETDQSLTDKFSDRVRGVLGHLETVSDREVQMNVYYDVEGDSFSSYKDAALKDPTMRTYTVEALVGKWRSDDIAKFLK